MCNITHTQTHYKAKFKKSDMNVFIIITISSQKKFNFNKYVVYFKLILRYLCC